MDIRKIRLALHRLKNLPSNKYLCKYLLNKVHQISLKFGKQERVAYPSTIMLELTNQCNLACTICAREYDYGRNMDIGQMDFELAKKILDETMPYLDSLGLTGLGETFLYKKLNEVVDYIRQRNNSIIISLSTNASFRGFIDTAAPLVGKVNTLQVSVDGLGDTYESIRKNASFRQLDDNLRQLSELCKGTGTSIMLNMVVTKDNYHQMSEMFAYARSYKINYLNLARFNIASATEVDDDYYDFYHTEEFLAELKVLEQAITLDKSIHVSKPTLEYDGAFSKCIFPWSHFYITWNGFVVPCCVKPFPKVMNFGSLHEETPITILNNKKYREFRRAWNLHEVPVFCRRCVGL